MNNNLVSDSLRLPHFGGCFDKLRGTKSRRGYADQESPAASNYEEALIHLLQSLTDRVMYKATNGVANYRVV